MISIIVCIIGSIAIIWVSRASLRYPRSHGFPRFFAFEAVFLLIVINAPYWFASPFAIRQIVSWLFLVLSIILVAWSVILLRRSGESVATPEELPMFGWEHTEKLVTTGIYRYVRHPMYSSLLFLAWGALLKSVTASSVILAGVATLALVVTARTEEAENLARFGDEYRNYMQRSRLFVPFLL